MDNPTTANCVSGTGNEYGVFGLEQEELDALRSNNFKPFVIPSKDLEAEGSTENVLEAEKLKLYSMVCPPWTPIIFPINWTKGLELRGGGKYCQYLRSKFEHEEGESVLCAIVNEIKFNFPKRADRLKICCAVSSFFRGSQDNILESTVKRVCALGTLIGVLRIVGLSMEDGRPFDNFLRSLLSIDGNGKPMTSKEIQMHAKKQEKVEGPRFHWGSLITLDTKEKIILRRMILSSFTLVSKFDYPIWDLPIQQVITDNESETDKEQEIFLFVDVATMHPFPDEGFSRIGSAVNLELDNNITNMNPTDFSKYFEDQVSMLTKDYSFRPLAAPLEPLNLNEIKSRMGLDASVFQWRPQQGYESTSRIPPISSNMDYSMYDFDFVTPPPPLVVDPHDVKWFLPGNMAQYKLLFDTVDGTDPSKVKASTDIEKREAKETVSKDNISPDTPELDSEDGDNSRSDDSIADSEPRPHPDLETQSQEELVECDDSDNSEIDNLASGIHASTLVDNLASSNYPWDSRLTDEDTVIDYPEEITAAPLINDDKFKELLSLAITEALSISQKESLLSRIHGQGRGVHKLGTCPIGQFEGLVENNPLVAADLMIELRNTLKFSEYLENLIEIKMTVNSMEVVNRLTSLIALPPPFLHMFVTKCIATCESLTERFIQNRLIRLVCVFLQSLIRNRAIKIEEMNIQIMTFCLEFSRIREATALYRLVKQLEAENSDITEQD